jgi:phosphate transport system substrate-binding protein
MLNRARAVIATAALFLAAAVHSAAAQDVELRSFDGTVELEGNLIAYDGAYYQIDTIYGPLTDFGRGRVLRRARLSRSHQFRGRGLYRGRRHRGRGPLARSSVGLRRATGPRPAPRGGRRIDIIYTLVRPGDQPAARFHVPPAPPMRGFSRS